MSVEELLQTLLYTPSRMSAAETLGVREAYDHCNIREGATKAREDVKCSQQKIRTSDLKLMEIQRTARACVIRNSEGRDGVAPGGGGRALKRRAEAKACTSTGASQESIHRKRAVRGCRHKSVMWYTKLKALSYRRVCN